MEDPVIKTVLETLDLLDSSVKDVIVETEKEYIRLDVFTTMQAVLLNGIIKGGEKKLKSKSQRDAFLHIHRECRKTMTVINKGCKDYAIKYGTKTIPGFIISKIIKETKRQIKNQ
mgnify:CR=1 FL=1